MCGGLFMWRKIKPSVMTILIMHACAVITIALISLLECFCEFPCWIEYALLMFTNIIIGIVCALVLKYCFHRRRYIKITILCYWITYVMITMFIGVGEEKNWLEMILILMLLLFSSSMFSFPV